ncbi:MAG: ABC transporter permease [Chloroflexota bacterium]|nr:MAG: ABC transporter permease [Chloroflexota bacterium]
MGLDAVASPTGLVIGFVLGLIPLLVGWRYRQWKWGVIGWLVCLFSSFGCGLIGGLPVAVLATSLVISYAFATREDPYTSQASLDEVTFDETWQEYLLRQMAALGHGVRTSARMLARNKVGFIGFAGVMFFVLMSAFGPLFIEYEGEANFSRRQPGASSLFQPPSAEFPLGLDWQGRSVLSHIVYGGRTLILTSIQAGLIATVIAVALGSLAALLGGFVDQAISFLGNFVLTIPQFPLLLVLASLISFNSSLGLALLFAALNWPALMRAVRAQALSLRKRDYVEAAVALDLGLGHVIMREVFPNMVSYIAVNFIFSVRSAMYALVGLVVLGIVPLSEPDWGVMIFMGRQQGALFNPAAASMLLSPIIAIAVFQLSLVLFARSLEEIFNPRLRSGV